MSHLFEFPRLRKVGPKSLLQFPLELSVSSWQKIEFGQWTLIASAGVLEESQLAGKLEEFGGPTIGRERMSAAEFLKLQTVVYSNRIRIVVSNHR